MPCYVCRLARQWYRGCMCSAWAPPEPLACPPGSTNDADSGADLPNGPVPSIRCLRLNGWMGCVAVSRCSSSACIHKEPNRVCTWRESDTRINSLARTCSVTPVFFLFWGSERVCPTCMPSTIIKVRHKSTLSFVDVQWIAYHQNLNNNAITTLSLHPSPSIPPHKGTPHQSCYAFSPSAQQ